MYTDLLCTRPDVGAVQRPVQHGEREDFTEEVVVFLHQEVPQDHADTHQKLEDNRKRSERQRRT